MSPSNSNAGPSYEPSIATVFDHILPLEAERFGSFASYRARVSWPVVARPTGMGTLQGGEIVLVPAGRVQPLIHSLPQLKDQRVAGLITADILIEPDRTSVQSGGIAVASIASQTNLRTLRRRIEETIVRRRRELFEDGQRVHRVLFELAVHGASIQDLLGTAEQLLDGQIILDRDGEIVGASDLPPSVDTLLASARRNARGDTVFPIYVSSEPVVLAVPVTTGRGLLGIVVGFARGDRRLDEHEAVLVHLATCCAIVLSRQPEEQSLSLEMLIDGLSRVPASSENVVSWSALAATDSTITIGRMTRALRATVRSRDLIPHIGQAGRAAVLLVNESLSDDVWKALLTDLGKRLGSSHLKAGISRSSAIGTPPATAAQQALVALERSTGNQITSYRDVEFDAVFANFAAGVDFARDRLRPLLSTNAKRQDLLATVATYLKTGKNASEAAAALQIHRNTLRYRLRTASELLDLDVHDPQQAFELLLAIKVLQANESIIL